MLEEKLEQIGFNKNEAKIYLELLSIGSQAVSIIAKRAGFNRTTTYSVLKVLEKKGLVASYKNNGVKFFAANDPNCLVSYLDARCRTFDYYRNEILTLIPKFRSSMKVYEFKKPVVSYFDGIEGVKYVMYDALKAKNEFCAYICLSKWLKSGLKDFLLQYKDFRITNKRVPLRAIALDTEEVRDFFKKNYDQNDPLTQIVYLKENYNKGILDNSMNIYDDKVAIIHLARGDEYGVLIESKEMANMQRGIFDLIWKDIKR